MTTLIELPDDLVREAEARAALMGKSLKETLTDGLRLWLTHGDLLSPPGEGPQEAETLEARLKPQDLTAWERLRAAYDDPFPGLTSRQAIREFRGPVELPPAQE